MLICKICGSSATLIGVVDRNKSCEEHRGKYLPLSGEPIYYQQCPGCGTVFTSAFDDWTYQDFRANIYNDGYLDVDPDYVEARPLYSASIIRKLFPNIIISVLDYGGGNGKCASVLCQQGYDAVTYDPFVPAHSNKPSTKFDLVTSFETVEHSPDPIGTFRDMVSFVKDDGLILFSTLLVPSGRYSRNDLTAWWYLAPRNGHLTIYTRKALAILFNMFGMTVGSFNDHVHVAFHSVPSWAAHVIGARFALKGCQDE